MHALAQSNELIRWSPELSVGIEEIDDQHRVLVDLLNDLNAATLAHHGAQEAPQILEKLIDLKPDRCNFTPLAPPQKGDFETA